MPILDKHSLVIGRLQDLLDLAESEHACEHILRILTIIEEIVIVAIRLIKLTI